MLGCRVICHVYVCDQMQSQSKEKPGFGSGDDSTAIWKGIFPRRASPSGLSIPEMIVNQAHL